MVCLFRQGTRAHNFEEVQRLRERTANLEMKVMKYEQENKELRSDLDTLV